MKYVPKTILIILIIFCLCGFITLFLPQKNLCSLETLILTDNMMPIGWTRFGRVSPPALPKQGAYDALGVIYENGSEIAHGEIYRYKNSLQSFFFLRINNQYYFPSGSWKWSDIDGSEDWGLNGDEYRIKCGESDDPFLDNLCGAVIRYGPYISEFHSSSEEGLMSLDEFEAIVVAIDEQISNCIQGVDDQR